MCIPAFEPIDNCPKCGGSPLRIRYEKSMPRGKNKGQGPHEFLSVKCSVCCHEHIMATKDAPSKKDDPEFVDGLIDAMMRCNGFPDRMADDVIDYLEGRYESA